MGEIDEIDFKLSGKDAEKDEKVNLWGGLDIYYILGKYKVAIFLFFGGLIFLVLGILVIWQTAYSEDKIEIISSEEKTSEKILVDIEGAVQKPGVYELSSGSRVRDLLIAAGGLSSEADREWVEKVLNQAEKLKDGVKIYIPKKGEEIKGASSSLETAFINKSDGLLNINTASKSELESLWGIGPATAQKIIDNRPYKEVSELLTKKILKNNVYQKIASQLTVY
jgi:competence protein ComEA